MRLQMALKIMAGVSRLFRLFGVEVIYMVAYTRKVEKLEDYINAHINND